MLLSSLVAGEDTLVSPC